MLDWDVIAPMIVMIVAIVTVGGVAILRPLAKRVSELLELYARERRAETEVGQVRDLLETMNARLQLLEERQDFTERLLAPGSKEERTGGRRSVPPEGEREGRREG